MWFDEVDVPEHLIAAHRDGRLVLFVGAGASIAAPSSHPSFAGLVAELAKDVNLTSSVGHPLDEALSTLRARGVNVHQRVRNLLSRAESTPNDLHRAIVALAASGPTVRIVTTNFDRHLSSVAEGLPNGLIEYQAPALPVGNDFDGIVYLHGHVAQPEEQLVLTAENFGAAYLTDAWAARFLERMFPEYVVLFVGYSHQDTVMRYVARGLRGDCPRYALVEYPGDAAWNQIRVEPVFYPNLDGTHGAVPRCLTRWAHRATMNQLDHAARVADLVQNPPSDILEEESYVTSVIEDDALVHHFTQSARDIQWLRFAAGVPTFASLFRPGCLPTKGNTTLATWFATHFALSEDHSAESLTMASTSPGVMSEPLWSALGWALHRAEGQMQPWMKSWIPLLIRNASGRDTITLAAALYKSRWPDDQLHALLLFEYLTDPLPAADHYEIPLRSDPHQIATAFTQVFEPSINACAADLLGIAAHQLARAHRLGVAEGKHPAVHDPTYFDRPALGQSSVEPDNSTLGPLVDIACAALRAALANGDPRAIAALGQWTLSDAPALKRLALYGWALRTDVDANQKLMWLRSLNALYEHTLRSEVYRLVQQEVPQAEASLVDALVDDALLGPPSSDGEDDGPEDRRWRAYRTYCALTWIAGDPPTNTKAAAAIAELLATYPDLGPAESPHQPPIEIVAWQSEAPLPIAAFHEAIIADPAHAIGGLLQLEGAAAPFARPTWWDAVHLVTDVVAEWPSDGLRILEVVPPDNELIEGVLRGWAKAELDDAQVEGVLTQLADLDQPRWTRAICELLAPFKREGTTGTAWYLHPAARALAQIAWTNLDDAPAEHRRDGLTTALNHPAGHLALFWLNATHSDWKAAGESWAGLPEDLRTSLTALLDGGGTPTGMAEILFTARLGFLHATDAEWCEAHILPLLNWADPVRAERAWNGYLAWGQANDRLLAAGLRDYFIAALQHTTTMTKGTRTKLCRHLASLTMSDAGSSAWHAHVAACPDDGVRAEWAKQVSHILRRLSPENVEAQWKRWMAPYWRARLNSEPVVLDASEAQAMSGWVLSLTDSFDEGVNLVTQRPVGLDRHSISMRRIAEDHAGTHPQGTATLMAHILRHSTLDYFECGQVSDLVGSLRASAPDLDLRPLIDSASQAGCTSATTW